MSRARKQAYRSAELSELARQLLYAPPDKRAEVVRAAERFHDAIDPAGTYPIDYVVYQLTQRRVPPSESVLLVGEALRPDLRLLIDTLSRSSPLTPDAQDPGRTTAELAESLGVSTKTIARWRNDGLRWRWVVREEGGKPTIVIPASAVQAFEARQSGRVDYAAKFTRLSDDESRRLIQRARRLANATNLPPMRILDHLARRTGRSAETLRLMIDKHDKASPQQAVFADRSGPLTLKQKRVIDRAYRRGVTVSAMCRRFHKTRSTIYRAIYEARAQRAIMQSIHVVDSPTFEREDADEVFLSPIKRGGRRKLLERTLIVSLPAELRPVYDQRIDPDSVTRSLIVRYNFIKHRARVLQDTLHDVTPRASDLNRFDELLQRADQVRGEIIIGTLPIVLSVVLRQMLGGKKPGDSMLLAMLDEANAVLIEEIERFDAARSHTFESVLTNRLQRRLASPDELQEGIDVEGLIGRLTAVGFTRP